MFSGSNGEVVFIQLFAPLLALVSLTKILLVAVRKSRRRQLKVLRDSFVILFRWQFLCTVHLSPHP